MSDRFWGFSQTPASARLAQPDLGRGGMTGLFRRFHPLSFQATKGRLILFLRQWLEANIEP